MLKLKRSKDMGKMDLRAVPCLVIPLLTVSDKELQEIQADGIFQEAPPPCEETTGHGEQGWQWALVVDEEQATSDQNEIVLALVDRETGDTLLVKRWQESSVTAVRNAALGKLGITTKWGSWAVNGWRLTGGKFLVETPPPEEERCPCCFNKLDECLETTAKGLCNGRPQDWSVACVVCGKTSGPCPSLEEAKTEFKNSHRIKPAGGAMMVSIRDIQKICGYSEGCDRACGTCLQITDYRRLRNG